MNIVDRDRAVLWHPYTQMLTAPAPLPIARAEGVWLYTEDGRRILDGISSWWVNIHGHSHPKLNAALAAQACELEHVVFAGCTHRPAVELAERLIEILPKGLARVVLFRQRIDRGGSRDEARDSVLAQPRAAESQDVHHAAPRLSRRHRRSDVG